MHSLHEGLIWHLVAKIEFPITFLGVHITSHHSQDDM